MLHKRWIESVRFSSQLLLARRGGVAPSSFAANFSLEIEELRRPGLWYDRAIVGGQVGAAGGRVGPGPTSVRGFPMESALEASEASGSESCSGIRLRRTESRFRGHGNVSLFCRSWSPETPRRTIVVVHGMGEHSGRYEAFAAWFAAAGAAVYSFDLRGHGRSAGPRGHVNSLTEYLNDLEIFLELVRGEASGLPLSLVGHSMGGLIVTALAVERDPDVTCFATSGAALMMSPAFSPAKILLARVMRTVAPRLSFESGLDPETISTIPEVVKRYREDPHVHGRRSVSQAVALIAGIRGIRGVGGRVQHPMMLMHGALDTLCPAEGSDSFYRSLPGAGDTSDALPAELRIYSRSRHEIFNDVESEVVFNDLLRFIERCEAESGVVDGQ